MLVRISVSGKNSRTRNQQFLQNKNSSTQMKGVSRPFRLENRIVQLQQKVLRGTLRGRLLPLPLQVSSA